MEEKLQIKMKHAFYALLHVVPFILASFKNNGVKRSTMNISYDVPPPIRSVLETQYNGQAVAVKNHHTEVQKGRQLVETNAATW